MILFAGDSFSHFSDEGSWPFVLSQNLNSDFLNLSFGGSSLWYTYKKIKENNFKILKNEFQYIIITCTSPQRIPDCSEPHLSYYVGNPCSIENYEEKFLKDILHFGYYERFFDRDLQNFLYKKILSDLVFQLSNHSKLILLTGFKDALHLIKEVYTQNKNFSYLNFPLIKLKSDIDDYKNHFNKETNITFGNILFQKITNSNFGEITLSIDEIKEALK